MARPLRKLTREGVVYARREIVEAEINELEKLSDDDVASRGVVWPKNTPGFISSEALLYFVRNSGNPSLRETLLKALLERIHRNLPKPNSLDGKTASMSSMAIRDKVRDDFIDLLLIDQADYDDRLDYFEVNFNGALARDRVDAKRQVQSKENRTQELGCEDEEISPEVEKAIESYDPFEPYELDKENYRRRLDAAINALPPLQQRIVEMWRQEIPIISKDPNEMTISKALKKSDKTIRTHRDYAFATLRKRLEEKEKV